MISRLAVAVAVVGGLATYGGTAFAAPTVNSHSMRSCATAPAGQASCDAILNTNAKSPAPGPTVTPAGYGPSDLWSAYALSSSSTGGTLLPPSGGGTQTVAIVDAYNDPNAEADLGVYRSKFGLGACTRSNGCLNIVSQNGTTSGLPTNNGGWAQEESLDLDMVSAICPSCHILLVEAKSASYANLGTAVNTAARLRATEISNSYGGTDSSSDSSYDAYYNHPGIAITASSGDGSYGVEYPASSPYVTAVGGTHLSRDNTVSRGWTETAWSGAGSGCSVNESAPTWQSSAGTQCAGRAVADVSADADPNTGVAVYDSYAYQGSKGWMVFGGTSVASPIIASVYALAGNASSVSNDGPYPYTHTASLNDVISGSNGTCPTPVWCTAGTGWDGPTGLGTPSGTGAF